MIKTEAYSGGGGKEGIPTEIWRRKKVGLMLNRGETDNHPFSPLSMNFKSKTKNQWEGITSFAPLPSPTPLHCMS